MSASQIIRHCERSEAISNGEIATPRFHRVSQNIIFILQGAPCNGAWRIAIKRKGLVEFITLMEAGTTLKTSQNEEVDKIGPLLR